MENKLSRDYEETLKNIYEDLQKIQLKLNPQEGLEGQNDTKGKENINN